MGEIDISKYEGYFHDGSVLNINHERNEIVFSITSAQMDEEDLEQDDIVLSKDDPFKCLRGKLHIEGIKKIKINDKLFLGIIKQEYDHGSILDLSIKKHSIKICVEWIDFPPKPRRNDFSVIKINAEKIYWENIPDLPWD